METDNENAVKSNDKTPSAEVKVVVVGDGAVGKTCLCHVFVHKEFPDKYVPTVFENHTEILETDAGKVVKLQLWDTAGQEDYKQLRTLSYENTDCFVVCFSVTDTISFNNVKSTWVQELRFNTPGAKILLVGTKADLRGTFSAEEAKNQRSKEVPLKKILRLVKDLRLEGYIETSAITQGDEVAKVFSEAVRMVVEGTGTTGKSLLGYISMLAG